MAPLVYSVIASLDGFVEDADGDFGWAAPDEEVHRFVNDLERPVGTYLYGRRMYETMAGWSDRASWPDQRPVTQDFGTIWSRAEKVVYSRTLDAPSTPRTRVERVFDPASIRAMKAAARAPISVGGAELAGVALRAGLVDECHLLVVPVLVGDGKRAFPQGVRQSLRLAGHGRFAAGVAHLHYRLTGR